MHVLAIYAQIGFFFLMVSDTMNLRWSIVQIIFVLPKRGDPDEMLHYAAFHLELHCLPNTHLGVSSIQHAHVQTV